LSLKKTTQSSLTAEQLNGYKTVEKFRRILSDKLSRRSAGDIHPTENDPRRTLACDDFFTLLFFALYNPVLKSMRAITEASHFAKVQEELSVDSVSLGSFSEAQHVFDPELLREIFKDLSGRIAFKPKASDSRLKVFIERMVAVDGSLFDALPRMSWAMYQTQTSNHKVKLHLLFEPLRGGIEDAVLTEGNACERKALKKLIRANKMYVGDRYYGLHYDFFKCFTQKKADFVFRIRSNPVYSVVQSHEVCEQARSYGVIADKSITFDHDITGHVWRLVQIEREGKTFMLLTNRNDIDADVVGMLYRNRWEIELFFKWMKCILKCNHFLLESPAGVAAQIYTALILALLLSSLTGKKPTLRQMEAMQLHLMGYLTDEELTRALLKK